MLKSRKKDVVSAAGNPGREIEGALVEMFSDLARMLGNPPSCGAIYGLLFASGTPRSMEEIIGCLGISKGSASQGLRQLTEIGAIQRLKPQGQRSARYVAELELRRLLSGFIQEQLAPRLANSATRLHDLHKKLPLLPGPGREIAQARLTKLSTWHERAASTLPLALQLLRDD